MPCEVSFYCDLFCTDSESLSAATLILINYALLAADALGNNVHSGRRDYNEFLSCRTFAGFTPCLCS